MDWDADTRDRVIRVEEQLKGLEAELDNVRQGVHQLQVNQAENARNQAESSRVLAEKIDAIADERLVEKGQKSVWIVIGTAIIAAVSAAATITAKFVMAKFGG